MDFDSVDSSVDTAKEEERLTRAREIELDEFRQLLNHKAFRSFLWRLMEHCKTFNSEVVNDPIILAAHSGLRNAGMWVFREIEEADEKAFTRMMTEAKERMNNG